MDKDYTPFCKTIRTSLNQPSQFPITLSKQPEESPTPLMNPEIDKKQRSFWEWMWGEPSDNVWNNIPVFVQWAIIIFVVITGLWVIDIIFGYSFIAPATEKKAKAHNRDVNWSLYYGFVFTFIVYLLYFGYVEIKSLCIKLKRKYISSS